MHLLSSPNTHTHTFALACAHTSQDDSYNCRDHKFTKSPVERWRTREDGLGIRSTRHSRAKVSFPVCPTRTKPGSVSPPRPAGSLSPRGRRGVVGRRRCQAGTLTFRAPQRADTRRWTGCRWWSKPWRGLDSATGDTRTDLASRDWRRRAVTRGRPHFPCPKVARRRGSARRGGARGARWPDQPAPRSLVLSSSRRGGRAEGSRRGGGEVSGGVAAVTEAARRAQRSARSGGRQRPSEHPAGRSSGQRRRWWPALPPLHGAARLGTRGATECARSARAKLAAAAPPRRLLPPLPAQRSPLLGGPTPPSSDSSRVPSGCSPAAV
jgi:hypothetical protein